MDQTACYYNVTTSETGLYDSDALFQHETSHETFLHLQTLKKPLIFFQLKGPPRMKRRDSKNNWRGSREI